MFPIGSSKTDWIWTVGSIPIVNQILTTPKRVENPRAYCPRALLEAGSPISEEAMYGGGDVTLNKGYLVGRRHIGGRTSNRKSDFLFLWRVFSACPVGIKTSATSPESRVLGAESNCQEIPRSKAQKAPKTR